MHFRIYINQGLSIKISIHNKFGLEEEEEEKKIESLTTFSFKRFLLN